MDYKNIMEGARQFFQGLPQTLGQNTPLESSASPTPIISSNGTDKELNHSLNNRLYPNPGVISNLNPTTGSSSLNNNNNTKTKEGESASVGGKSLIASLNRSKVAPGVKSPLTLNANTSGKSGNGDLGGLAHPAPGGGHPQHHQSQQQQRSSSQSRVPIHVPLTIPLPNHNNHQEQIPLPRPKYEEGLGATLTQMYAGSLAGGGRGPSSQVSRHMLNGAPAGLLQTAPPLSSGSGGSNDHGIVGNKNSTSSSKVVTGSSSGGGGGGSGSSAVKACVVKSSMGGATVRRESPLDLSVKTVRQSADSSTTLEAPIIQNGSISGGGSGSGASTPNNMMMTPGQHHYSLQSSTIGEGVASSMTSATGRPLTVGDTVNSVIAAVANSTTGMGVGLSSSESRSSGKSRGRSREKSHERENNSSSSRSRTSTPTGGSSSGALRYPSPAHSLHRQQSPSGTASPHLHQHQRVAGSLQLNIPNPTPPPRTASGSSVNSSVGVSSYNPAGTPQPPIHPSPTATPGVVPPPSSHPPHHLLYGQHQQHPYSPSPAPSGAAPIHSSTGKGLPPVYNHPHYQHQPPQPSPHHHLTSAPQGNSFGSHHSSSTNLPPGAVQPPSGSPSSAGSHQPKPTTSTIPPYNPHPPSLGASLNSGSGYPPLTAHHHYIQHHHPSYHQPHAHYHQQYPAHHPPPTSQSVQPQQPPAHHASHHHYYSSMYGHHPHNMHQPQQPTVPAPPSTTAHQRTTPTSTGPAASAANPSAAPSPVPSGTPAATASSTTTQYPHGKTGPYPYPPTSSHSSQSSQPQQPSQAAATPAFYHHPQPNPHATHTSSYYVPPQQHASSPSTQQMPHQQQSRPASSSSAASAVPPPATQHHPSYAHYGHATPNAATTSASYSHSQPLQPTGVTHLNYPTYVPQAQRTQHGQYVHPGYQTQSSYYQQGHPPNLRPTTPTGPPPQQQPSSSVPHYQLALQSTPGQGKAQTPPSTVDIPAPSSDNMKPPQNPTTTSGKSPKSGSSRKNLLHMLRHSVENRMSEKEGLTKDKFQFNHQTWNFHGKKYNTTLPAPAHLSSNGSQQQSGVGSPGATSSSLHLSRPSSPNGTTPSFGDPLKAASAGQPLSKYESGGGSSSAASSTCGGANNGGSEGSSSTSGIGSMSDSSQFNRIRTKAEKKQLFPNLLSQIEQENNHKEAEKLQQLQQQHPNYYTQQQQHPTSQPPPQLSSSTTGKTPLSRTHSGKSKKLSTESTSVFDFQEDEDQAPSSQQVSPVAGGATATTTPSTVPEGSKPPKKPKSPKKATEPGSRRNSLPKSEKKSQKKVKQTPEQQQELMAAVIASVTAQSSSHAAAAEAHQRYLESLKNKELLSPPLPGTLSTPLKIPNPSIMSRESSGTGGPILPPPSTSAGLGTPSEKKEIKVTANSEGRQAGTSGNNKASIASTGALESMDAFWDVCDSFLDDLQSNPVSIKSRRGGLWQKLKEKQKPKTGDATAPTAAASQKVRKGRVGPRVKKNSSDEDSDFEVEKSSEEDEDEEESEQSDKSDSGDESGSDASIQSRKGSRSNSGDSSGFRRSSRKGAKKKTKRIIESEDEDDDGKGSEEDEDVKSEIRGRKGSRSVSSKKPRSTSKAASSSSSIETDKGKKKGRGKGKQGGHGGKRRSGRRRRPVLGNNKGISTLSDLDEDEDATSRSSIGSVSDEASEFDSDASSLDSSMSDGESSSDNGSESGDDSDGHSYSSSTRKRKKEAKGGKKAKRAKLQGKHKKGKERPSRKTGKKSGAGGGSVSEGNKRTRSTSTKNGGGSGKRGGSRSTSTGGKKDKENIHDSEFSDDDSGSVAIKRSRSLRSRPKGQTKEGKGPRKLRPKRNCAPAPGNRKLKDISESEEEEEQVGGSSGEEWIMRNELGKKKRRIVFGDGSEFQRPGWEEELIDFKKNKLRMPHKLIRVAKPSSLSLSPSGNGAQSTASSITGAITDSPAKSTKENKSPNTTNTSIPVTIPKGSKQQRKDKSPEKEKDVSDLIKDKPAPVVEVAPAAKEKKGKGRLSKTPTPVSSTTTTPSKKESNAAAKVKAEKPGKGGKKETKESKEKPVPAKGKSKTKGAKGKPVVDKVEHYSDSSAEEPNEPLVERAVEQMKAATKREAKINLSPSVKSAAKPGVTISEPKGKKGAASKTSTSANSAGNVSASANSEALPLPTSAEVPSPTSSTSTALTPNSITVPRKACRRNKFKSGFDYIRKKKKATAAVDGASAPPPPKRVKAAAEKNTNVEDIQAEVRSWVLNKGLGETALHRAARLGYPDVAAWTLDTDYCQPNCKDNAGYTPLHETCIKGNLEVAKVLLRYGANPSQAAPGGIRPLHEACENGHAELVRLLISYGADPTVATYAGQMPLELAENHESVKLLLHQHINDVQGKMDKAWEFRGSGAWSEELHDSGFDVTDDPPPVEPDDTSLDGFEFEASERALPNLYRLKDHTAHFVLLNEVLAYLSQPRDKVLKNLPGTDVVELNSNDFLEQAHCCALMGEKFNFNAISELTLIKYDDRVKRMLGVESSRIK